MLRGGPIKQKCARSRILALVSRLQQARNILVERRTPAFRPPSWTLWQALWVHSGSEFVQSTRINAPLEVNDLVNWPPEVDPANSIEFRRGGTIESNSVGVRKQSQNEPTLLLPDAQWFAVAPNEFVRQPVA